LNIYIESLKKNFGDRCVLDLKDIYIEHNKISTILGMNGSGKSTLLASLSGILNFDSGKISYDGKDIKQVKKDISMMLQNFYIFNDTAINNIKLPLKFLKFSDDEMEKRINKYVEYFNIKDYLNKNATKLSGGEKAKIALIRAVISERDMIFLDEPTTNMDMEGVVDAERLILYLKSIGKTIVLVTHNFIEAERLSDYVIFLENGKVLEKGEKKDVFNNPKNELVRRILGNRGGNNA